MNKTSRFVINRSGFEFSLNEDNPWSGSVGRLKQSALLLGWRCVSIIPPGRIGHAESFKQSSNGRYARSTHGHKVNVSVRSETKSEIEMALVIDLWTHRPRSTSSDIQQASEALDIVRKEVAEQIDLGDDIRLPWSLRREQEFLEVKLPRFVARHLSIPNARARIAPHLERDEYRYMGPLPTLQVTRGTLRLGPEPPGAVEGVRRFLDEETSEKATDAILTSHRYHRWSWVPVAMAGLLVLTWCFPLRPWSVALVAGLLLGLMILAVLPARDVGWRQILRKTTVVAALGFFGIGVFGVAYAVCALTSEDALGRHVTRLGYPFLVSTGLGVAGGILGDNPTGVARILAHVQLLLFLSGLIGVVAMLLRIDRGVRPRG